MTSYYNTNDAYGEPGPFEANSPEALADEMEGTFKLWAEEKVQRLERDNPEALWDTDCLEPGQTFAEYFAAEMREEFIAGLEVR